MTTYRYKGQTKDGTAVSGVIRAYDEFEADVIATYLTDLFGT